MSDNEVVNNFDAVLEKIGLVIKVVVEHDHRPVALIRSPQPGGPCCPIG